MDIAAIISRNLTALMASYPDRETLEKVAHVAHVGFSTVRRAKNGDGNLTVQNLDLIARAFRRTAKDLLAEPIDEYGPAAPATVAEAPVVLAAAAAAALQPVRTRKAERAAVPARQASAPRLVAGADAAEQVAAPVAAPQPPIATRPWPRSVLPQYATGGLAVGFGEGAAATPHNPFRQPRLVMVPVQAPVADRDSPAADAPATDTPAAADAPVPAEP